MLQIVCQWVGSAEDEGKSKLHDCSQRLLVRDAILLIWGVLFLFLVSFPHSPFNYENFSVFVNTEVNLPVSMK